MPGIAPLAVSVGFIARQGACDKIFREYNELSLLCYGNLDKLLGLFEILLWLKLLNLKLYNSNVTLQDRKSTRLNSSHTVISYAVFCLKKKKKKKITIK